jgi:hypothetical protein
VQNVDRRASPFLAFGIRFPVLLDGQQTGDRFLSARNDALFTSFDGRQQHDRVLLEFFYCGSGHADKPSLVSGPNQPNCRTTGP